jgi:RND family efflux transporter MFP subunit
LVGAFRLSVAILQDSTAKRRFAKITRILPDRYMKSTPSRLLSRSCFGLLLLTVLTGCSTEKNAIDSDDANELVAVKAVSVQQMDSARSTVAPASVLPFFQTELRPKVTGYAVELNADIGDVVSAGDILVLIDLPEMQKQAQTIEARLQRLDAEAIRAEAGVKLAAAGIKAAEAKVEQAKSDVDRVEADVAASESEFNRTSDLVNRQSVQPKLLDEARSRRDSDLAQRASILSAIQAALADVEVARAKKTSAEADLQAALADKQIAVKQLEELRVMIDYGSLKAPFAGVITARDINPGDLVGKEQAADRPLMTISQIDKLRVHIPVPERDAASVAAGDEVELSFPSYPDEVITVKVSRLTHVLDPSTRTMLVEADIDNKDGKLMAGMFGQATIRFSSDTVAGVLPARAVRFDSSGNAFVYVIDRDDVVSVSRIKIGADDGRLIEVTEGLSNDQRVIDAHLQRFVDGQKVTVLN